MSALSGSAAAKAATAFRTIGEVASEMGVPPHVLRFWESKFSQIKPHKRRGGHRYYRPSDVELIREIHSLLYDRGFTIKGAQRYLKEQKSLKDKGAQQVNLFDVPAAPQGVANDSVASAKREVEHAKMRNVLEELKNIAALLRTDVA
jgi:DNA-binding transcriptional MerR regulator